MPKALSWDKLKKLALAISISGVLVALLLRIIDPESIISTLSSIDPFWVIIGFSLYALSYFFRVLRFRVLLQHQIAVRELYPTVCMHNLINNILPFRTGEFSYVYLVKRLHGVPSSEGVATLAIARIFDVISISMIFILGTLLFGDPPAIIVSIATIGAIVVTLSILILIAAAKFGEDFANSVDRFADSVRISQYGVVRFALKENRAIVKGFYVVRSVKVAIGCLVFSLLLWGSSYLMTFAVLQGMDIDLGISAVVLGVSFSLIATALPINGIMSFGTHESMWAVGFMALGLSASEAITSGFSFHIVVIAYYTVLGVYGCVRCWTCRR